MCIFSKLINPCISFGRKVNELCHLKGFLKRAKLYESETVMKMTQSEHLLRMFAKCLTK